MMTNSPKETPKGKKVTKQPIKAITDKDQPAGKDGKRPSEQKQE